MARPHEEARQSWGQSVACHRTGGPWRRFSCPIHSGATPSAYPNSQSVGQPGRLYSGVVRRKGLFGLRDWAPTLPHSQALQAAGVALAWNTYTRQGQVLTAGEALHWT